MDNLSDKIKGIISGVATEVNDTNKEFVNEKISASEKKESIKVIVNTAEYRATNLLKSSFNDILLKLKEERINPAIVERVKTLINEQFGY